MSTQLILYFLVGLVACLWLRAKGGAMPVAVWAMIILMWPALLILYICDIEV